MHVDERRGAAGGRDHVAGFPALLEARRNQLSLDVHDPRHRLVAMVGARDQQHVLSPVAQAIHGLHHAGEVGIRLAQHAQMLRRAQRHHVLAGVGLAHPEQRQRRPPLEQRLVDETQSHGTLARRILGDLERAGALDALAAGAERSRTMIDVAMAVRIVCVGRARRHVREQDHAAVGTEPLCHGRHRQRTPRHAPLVLQELGVAGIVMDKTAVLHQRQRIALQLVAGRRAPGRERGGDHAGGRREHGPMGGETLRAGGKARQRRGALLADQIPAHAVQHHHDGPAHHVLPLPAGFGPDVLHCEQGL